MPSLFGALKSSLSRSTPADEDDVLSVKGALNQLGYYEKPDYGLTQYTDDAMFHSIKKFQRDHNLSVDGVMNPEGETETNLRKAVQQQAFPLQLPPLKVPVPAYRKDIFKPYARRKEWETWTNLNLNDESLPLVMRGVFNDVFAAEGGMKQASRGSAVAGILQDTLKELDRTQLLANVKKLHNGKIPATSDLTPQSAQEAYKAYFNYVLQSPLKKYTSPVFLNKKSGTDLMGELGSVKISGAVSDTLFRHGIKGGTFAIQRALGKALSLDRTSDGNFGTGTFNELKEVSGNKQKGQIFLNTLASDRKTFADVEPGEYYRFDYFK